MKRQISLTPVIALVLLIAAGAAYFLLAKPKQDESGRLADDIAQLETQVELAAAAPEPPKSDPISGPVTIEVADLFRLTKAMPDDTKMPGIILELNAVASAAGVEFVSIAPQAAAPSTGYTAIPINLTFEGNYYDLTDFLFRLRNLVNVRDGTLSANGRLFTIDSLALQEGPDGFPHISAALTVSAYLYSPDAGEAAAAAPAPTGTGETTTTPAGGGEVLGGTP